MNANRLKAKLAAGGAGLGCSLVFPSPQLVENKRRGANRGIFE
jgi:hypothetical protein